MVTFNWNIKRTGKHPWTHKIIMDGRTVAWGKSYAHAYRRMKRQPDGKRIQ